MSALNPVAPSLEAYGDFSNVAAAPPHKQAKLPAHIPALDGLRGVAILMVLAFHFTPEGKGHSMVGLVTKTISQFGWCGVDLFFVLSGFLITGILYDAKGSANYFRNFYMRRVLRVFSLYFWVLSVGFFLFPRVFEKKVPFYLGVFCFKGV